MKIAKNLFETVGNTPLLKFNRVTKGLEAQVLGKIEYFSPSGSVKDRIAFRMIEAAEKRGDLKPGYSIIEATTGNTGIAFSMAAAVKGYKMIVVMPSGMSEERKKIIRAYGAELIETPGAESDVDKTIVKVKELAAKNPTYWIAGQFDNQDNTKAHYTTTGQEILEQTDGSVTAFVAAIGTGGTLTGVALALKKKIPNVFIVAVEPEECPILSGGQWGTHKIEGIGDGFIPAILQRNLINEVVTVSSEDAIQMAKRLAREEGLFCGISSGCNVVAALKVAKKFGAGKNVVTMISDSGQRYFSTDLCK